MNVTDLPRPYTAPYVPERLLSVSEAARYCNVSGAYIRYSAQVRKLPCCRVGMVYAFHQADLDSWNLERQERKAAKNAHRAGEGIA